MEPLADALADRLDSYGLKRVVTAAMIVEAANRVLPSYARAKTFRSGVLTVGITSSPKVYFFQQQQALYLEQIAAALGQSSVTAIRLRIEPPSQKPI